MGPFDWLGGGGEPQKKTRGAAWPEVPMCDFVAVDVETASAGRHTICQLGAVAFHAGREVFAEEFLIDPRCGFEPFNTRLHGIAAGHVRGAPHFGEAYGRIGRLLADRIVVAHSDFDRQALSEACEQHRLPAFLCRWLDSVGVARRTWPDLRDHKLSTLADHFGIGFRHHSAVEDARLAGIVVSRAMDELGLGIEDWFARPKARSFSRSEKLARVGAEEGPLVGETVVMTGDFAASKGEMADQIQAAGGSVAASVSRKTTMLVLGRQDPSTFAGKEKSSKHLRAEELLAAGQRLVIISEAELLGRLRR
jgi:DNA polymerase-3 subunit epsilon